MDTDTAIVAAGSTNAAELLAVLDDTAARLAALPRPGMADGGPDAWSEVVRACQQVVNTATAVQDEAIVALAAIETVEAEDGAIGSIHKTPGHVSLDAPAIVSFALDVTSVHAERRVRDAVRRAADGPAGTATCTGLGGLHDAMRTGALDAYRAGVVAFELEEAPAEVADAVIAALGASLTSLTGPRLRSRCRQVLARVSPDLLRTRATAAREQCVLRRWVEQPGVDTWEGTFPSEDAARAWAAIDARAQQLVADGVCARVGRARAQALIDLVMGSATVTTTVLLTVSADEAAADAVPGADPETVPDPVGAPGAVADAQPERTQPRHEQRKARSGDLLELPHPLGGEPMLPSRGWLDALLGSPSTTVTPAPCHPVTGALRSDLTTDAYRPPRRLAALVRRRDRRCRFPGCHAAARFTDLDHVRPWPAGPTADRNLLSLCRRHHRIKQRPGWSVTLHSDGTATWTDPTGRTRTTTPVDALHHLVLPDTSTTTSPRTDTSSTDTPSSGRSVLGRDVHSGLAFALEHLLGDTPPARTPPHRRTLELHPTSGIAADDTRRPCRASTRKHRSDSNLDAPTF